VSELTEDKLVRGLDSRATEIRARVLVRGKVQKVFFRDGATNKSKELGVSGWVRNNADGSVEAVFEGKRENVLEALKWFIKGPEEAEVKFFDIKYEELQGLKGFQQL